MLTLVDIQKANEDGISSPPDEEFRRWVNASLELTLPADEDADRETEVSIRIVDNEEMRELNQQYRQQDKTTNVLSFPSEFPEELNIPLLGDIVISAAVVESEAIEQNKSTEAHWAHMTVHGMLHLLGYDHIDDDEAQVMEALETRILESMGYPAPYQYNDNENRPIV